jgi:ATP:ADP antiporter, AAA family
MGILGAITEINSQFRYLGLKQRKNLLLISLTMFFLLFSYPMVRSLMTAIFLDSHGAKNSPLVWIYSVLTLSIVTAFYNGLQERLSIHKLFLMTGLSSIFFFLLGKIFFDNGLLTFAYPLYILKEIYIVLLVHSALGYLNSSVDEKTAKLVYGPLGAVGSLGGILGGFLTISLSQNFPLNTLLYLSMGIITLAIISFWFTDRSFTLKRNQDGHKGESPLHSIGIFQDS